MAIKPVRARVFEAYPLHDARAEGYVTLYTKSGWDRWRMAIDQISEDLKARNAGYAAALEAYKLQASLIADERLALAKKIDDVRYRRVQAENTFNENKLKAQAIVDKFNADKETTSRQKEAVVPSVSAGTGSTWSSGSTNAKRVMEPKVKADTDYLLASPTGGLNNLTKENAAEKAAAYSQRVDNGVIGGTQDDRDQAAAMGYERLVADVGESAAKAAMPPSMAMGVLRYNSKYGSAGVAGATGIPGSSASRGAYQAPYSPEVLAQAQSTFDASAFDTLSSDLEAKLKASGNDLQALKVPVIEPLDMITTARKTYADKFGDVPSGTNLRMGGESIGKYKQLMPFEMTNAMKKTEDFFQMYIDDALKTAKGSTGKELNADEFNTAVEAGKERARQVLFGGFDARDTFESTKGSVRPSRETTPGTNIEQLIQDLPVTTGEGPQPSQMTPESTQPIGTSPVAQEIPVRPVTVPAADTTFQGTQPSISLPAEVSSGGIPTYESLPGLKTSAPITSLSTSLGGFGGVATTTPGPRFTTSNPAAQLIAKVQALYPEGPPVSITESPEWKAAIAALQAPSVASVPLPTTTAPSVSVGTAPSVRTQAPAGVPDIGTKQEGEISTVPVTEQVPNAAPTRPGYSYENPVSPPELDMWWRPQPPATRELDKEPTYKNEPQPGLTPDKHGSRKVYSVDDKDRMAKAKIFMEAAKVTDKNPTLAANKIVKTPAGRYVSALYDENKNKGQAALDLGQLTEHVVREYAGDPAAQKAAVARLVELSMLDVGAKKLS